MKKISTLILFAVIAITAMALPKSTITPLKQIASAKEQIANTTVMPEQATAFMQHNVTKHAIRPSKNIKQQPQATTETITLNGEGFLVGPEYEAETGEWYIAVEAQGYTFRLCWYGPADTYCGSFDIYDISFEYTWGWFQSADLFYQIYPSDINMTISEKQIGNHLKQITLDATIIDQDDNTYILHIVHNIFTPTDTISTELDNAQITVGGGSFILDGNNADMDIRLAINSATVDGTYTNKDINTNATEITYKGVAQKILQANLNIASTNLSNGALGYLAKFSFYNQDTVLHTISMTASLPTPQDTINISCTNLVVDESLAAYGIINLTGASELYDVMAFYEGFTAETGIYKNASVVVSDMITWEMIQSISAEINLKETIEGWQANIKMYGSDYKYYVIDMKYVVPEPTDTVSISFDKPAIATFQSYNNNMLQLLNYGNEYEASITIFDVKLGESFTMDNVYLDYCGINKTEEYSIAIADIKGTLNQYGDTTIITASIIGFDAVQYDIKWWYAAPTPVDTIEIDMPIEFINTMADGFYTLAGFTPDSAWYVSLSPITQEVAGTFTNDGLFGKFGAADGAYDFYGGNSFIRAKDGEVPFTIEKGTLTVNVAADSTIIAEATVVCTNAICYHIKMVSEYNTHLDHDEPYTEVDRTYTIKDNVFIEDKVDEAGYVYLSLTAADGSDQAAFFFYVEEKDPDIIIPAGTYPINSSEDYGTVLANPGVQGNGVWPSYYALLAEDGALATPLWLLIEGTVEVTKSELGEVYLEVYAVNSYKVPVHIIYNGYTTTNITNAIEPQSQTSKYIKNGQLFIQKNNQEYNAQGLAL